jgi:transcriptional regulator with XRE-family HTH domain
MTAKRADSRPWVSSAEVFGRVVAHLRQRAGLSSRDLAAAMDIAPASVGRIEAGGIDPTFQLAARVSKVLAVRPIESLGGAHEAWNATLLLDLTRHVLGEVSEFYRPAWVPRGKSLPKPNIKGKAVAGLVHLPVARWLQRMHAAGWPTSVLAGR